MQRAALDLTLDERRVDRLADVVALRRAASTRTSPVSSSTSTSAAQAAYEMAAWGGRSTLPVSGSTIAAYGFSCAPVPVISSPCVHVAAAATSGTLIFFCGAPFAMTSPSTISRSPGSISSSLPAISSSFCLHSAAAFRTALPATNVAREANVPVQTGDESVFELS